MIYNDFTELIGATPLVYLKRIAEENGCCARIAAKLERNNPAGSAKDRVALNMIRRAEDFRPSPFAEAFHFHQKFFCCRNHNTSPYHMQS